MNGISAPPRDEAEPCWTEREDHCLDQTPRQQDHSVRADEQIHLVGSNDSSSLPSTPSAAAPEPLESKDIIKSAREQKNEAHSQAPALQQCSSRLGRCVIFVNILVLALVFAAWLAVYSLHQIWHEYYVPLIQRAQRTDEDLLEEYTYYERTCHEYDLTTHNLSDLLLPPTTSAALEVMMKHGGVMIPRVLDPATVQELRQHLVQRNHNVTADEAFPVSQGSFGLRVSYGIDATEHPAVISALRRIAHHATIRPLLQQLTGDDNPAVAEITAITAYAGVEEQVWHADTKGDGNALKFARTYSHSYSLFIPLQDTTEAMGATDVCPGTHYCMNDLEYLCEQNKLGLYNANPDRQVWEAGDAALLNQHVWHRGGAHSDPEALERIVFIVSFLARPPQSQNLHHPQQQRPRRLLQQGTDLRQLSRGTYFHQRWNMWGHTWDDLLDPASRMKRPYSILRALSLWKWSNAHWGYDLITATVMRFANDQLEDEELTIRFKNRLRQLHVPEFLQGRILMNEDYTTQREQWEVFVQETIDKTFQFLLRINVVAHGIFLASLCLIRRIQQERQGRPVNSQVRNCVKSVLVTHGVLLLMTFYSLRTVRMSPWGQDILSGLKLMRPFPAALEELPLLEDEEVLASSASAPTGLSTLPTRLDVLIGTRYDAPFLGSYDHWLDYHPGNVDFNKAVRAQATLYSSFNNMHNSNHSGLGLAKLNWLEQDILQQAMRRGGRFLWQDYRTGDWRIMTVDQSLRLIRQELLAAGSKILRAVQKAIQWMMAEYRFGILRQSALARTSLKYLPNLQSAIFFPTYSGRETRRKNLTRTGPLDSEQMFLPLTVTTTLPSSKTTLSTKVAPFFQRSAISFPLQSDDQETSFDIGDLVWVSYPPRDWFPGSVMAIDGARKRYTIAFDDGSVEADILQHRLQPYVSVTEGDFVQVCFQSKLQDCYPYTVTRVHPSGRIDAVHEDGSEEWLVSPKSYYLPPFRYGWDYYY